MTLRQAVAVAQGVGVVFRRGRLERAYFDALALTEGEVEELEFRTNVERSRQAALARHGMHDGP